MDIDRDNLERAARAVVGDNGVNIITELARLLQEAEDRGYDKGYDDGAKDAWIDWPAEDDLRDPIINAHVEGAPFTDMSELHVENRSPISDAEAYEALEQHYEQHYGG